MTNTAVTSVSVSTFASATPDAVVTKAAMPKVQSKMATVVPRFSFVLVTFALSKEVITKASAPIG